MATDLLQLSLEDKLYRTKFEADPDHPHVRLEEAICRKCGERVCLIVCPAGVYKANPNDPELVAASHENCLECGTCRMSCPHDAIDWRFPDGGMGVKYRYG